MSKEALHDAFMAGYRAAIMHKNRSRDLGEREFEKWYREAVESGNRAPVARKKHYDTWEKERDIATEGQRAAIFYDKQEKGE